MSRDKYFNSFSIGSSSWTSFKFGLSPSSLISITSDPYNTDTVLISFDGTNTHFILNPGEPLNLTNDFTRQIWLKANSSTQTGRLLAY